MHATRTFFTYIIFPLFEYQTKLPLTQKGRHTHTHTGENNLSDSPSSFFFLSSSSILMKLQLFFSFHGFSYDSKLNQNFHIEKCVGKIVANTFKINSKEFSFAKSTI